jgi:hypothetical protein
MNKIISGCKLAIVSGMVSVPIIRATDVPVSVNHPYYIVPLIPYSMSDASQ